MSVAVHTRVAMFGYNAGRMIKSGIQLALQMWHCVRV
jgi:hypothetical protein